jgi:hypothetical protein
MKKRLYYILGLILLGMGCTEVTMVEPGIGPPVIRFVDIQPKVVTEFEDSIVITFSYRDENGDLGNPDPDVLNLKIQDARLENPDFYHLQLLAPPNDKLTIEGTVHFKLKNTALLGAGGDEQTSYELTVTDRAGNESNPIFTDVITITRP